MITITSFYNNKEIDINALSKRCADNQYQLMGSWYQPLFQVSVSVISKDVTNIVINILIMLFLVIITSLIAFMILAIIEKMRIFIERIRNKKVDIISDQYQYLPLSVYRKKFLLVLHYKECH